MFELFRLLHCRTNLPSIFIIILMLLMQDHGRGDNVNLMSYPSGIFAEIIEVIYQLSSTFLIAQLVVLLNQAQKRYSLPAHRHHLQHYHHHNGHYHGHEHVDLLAAKLVDCFIKLGDVLLKFPLARAPELLQR